jgi:hypothetical protein
LSADEVNKIRENYESWENIQNPVLVIDVYILTEINNEFNDRGYKKTGGGTR